MVTFTEEISNGKLHFLYSVRVRHDIKKASKFRFDILQCEPNDRCFQNYRQISSENYRQISSNIAIYCVVRTELYLNLKRLLCSSDFLTNKPTFKTTKCGKSCFVAIIL